MKPQYAIILTLVALIIGYVLGIGYGRRHEGDAWRLAITTIGDDCRYAVRDALRARGWE